MKVFSKLALLGAVAALSTVASASIIVDGDQSASGSLGTINLPSQNNGFTVFGVADNGAHLNFTSNETLVAVTGNGQARIEALDGSWSTMTIQFDQGYVFERMVFNLISDGTSQSPTSGTITAYNQFNVQSVVANFTLSSNGQNFFNVLASSPDLVSRVVINVNGGTTASVSIDDIQQVRVGGITTVTTNSVPEPQSAALLGSGLIALALAGKRMRRK